MNHHSLVMEYRDQLCGPAGSLVLRLLVNHIFVDDEFEKDAAAEMHEKPG